ncbi:VOC family protein [Reinekea marina]|uniref:VOC family protein n=2 Tax=Reinekea marina TaxID=1310421 RepID=A0ABV7WNC5_9GAMM
MTTHIRHGIGNLRPYIHGPLSLIEFITQVFNAIELERHVFGSESCHVELNIDGSVLVIEAGQLPEGAEGWLNSLYIYVPDVNATYQTAIKLGAESIAEPEDKPYQERQAAFKDLGGNTWWISTYFGSENP